MKRYKVVAKLEFDVYAETEMDALKIVDDEILNGDIELIPDNSEPNYALEATAMYETNRGYTEVEIMELHIRFLSKTENVEFPDKKAEKACFEDYVRNCECAPEEETGAIRKVWEDGKPLIASGYIWEK